MQHCKQIQICKIVENKNMLPYRTNMNTCNNYKYAKLQNIKL